MNLCDAMIFTAPTGCNRAKIRLYAVEFKKVCPNLPDEVVTAYGIKSEIAGSIENFIKTTESAEGSPFHKMALKFGVTPVLTHDKDGRPLIT